MMQINMPPKQSSIRAEHWTQYRDRGVAILIGGSSGFFVLMFSDSPIKFLAVALGLLIILIAILKIEWGMLALVLIIYTHLSHVANVYHGVPGIINIVTVALILGIILRYLFADDWPSGWGNLALLIVLYGLIGISSFLYAADIEKVNATLWAYAKGSIIAIIIVIILKNTQQLRALFWIILFAGIFLGTLSCFQYITNTFDNNYWGFCSVKLGDIVGKSKGYRLGGPLGSPGFFAQILLVIIPLSLNRLLNERHILLRLLAVYAFLVTMLSILLTYSRGSFIGLMAMWTIFFILYPSHRKKSLTCFLLLLLVVTFLSPTDLTRQKSLQNLLPGVGQGISSDSSFTGRTSEMLVALHLFADHPIRGVGIGNYSVHYKKYANQIFLDFRQESRKAHSRYLEIMAETGLLGITAFGIMIWLMFRNLMRAQKKANIHGLEDLAGMITPFGIAMVGYLTVYLFLHGDFQRYFWLLIGIGYAIPNIVNNEVTLQNQTSD